MVIDVGKPLLIIGEVLSSAGDAGLCTRRAETGCEHTFNFLLLGVDSSSGHSDGP